MLVFFTVKIDLKLLLVQFKFQSRIFGKFAGCKSLFAAAIFHDDRPIDIVEKAKVAEILLAVNKGVNNSIKSGLYLKTFTLHIPSRQSPES